MLFSEIWREKYESLVGVGKFLFEFIRFRPRCNLRSFIDIGKNSPGTAADSTRSVSLIKWKYYVYIASLLRLTFNFFVHSTSARERFREVERIRRMLKNRELKTFWCRFIMGILRISQNYPRNQVVTGVV